MNRKQFIILLVLVVCVGAAGLFVRQRGKTSWQSSGQTLGQKLLPGLPVNDIAQITVRAGGNEMTLARRDDVWRVRERNDYPANFAEISGLLLKFADLKAVQTEEVGPSQLGRFELLPPGAGPKTGTQVEFKDAAGKIHASLLLGKKHLNKSRSRQFGDMGGEGWPDGRYVIAGSGAKTVALISDPLENVQPRPESWLNKEFFAVESPLSIAVQFPEATNSWKMTRAGETNDWLLADAKADEKLDPARIAGVTSPFSAPDFSDVAPPGAALTNATTITILTSDGFTYVATVGAATDGSYPARISVAASLPAGRVAGKDEKPEDKTRLDKEFKDQQAKLSEKLAREKQFANWQYRLPSHVVDQLLKPRGELLAENKPDKEAPPAK